MPAPIKIDILGIDKFTKVLGGISSRAEGFGKRMRGIGKQLAIGLSLPASLFGKAAFDAAATFEKSFGRIGVITGASGAEMEKLRALTTKLGTTTRFSSIETVQAFENMTDAGFTLQQGLIALPKVLEMAKIGAMDIGKAVETTDTIMEAYGKTAADIGKVNDILAVASPIAGAGFGSIAKSIETLSPVAQQLGISLEDMTATLTLAGSSGLNLTRATRGLGIGLTTLLEPSTKAIKAFTTLGIVKSDLFKKDGGLRSISEVFDTLRKKGATTNDMMDIFGRIAGPIMATLLGRGSGALKDIRDQMTGTTGTAEKMSKAMGENTSSKIAKMTASFDTLKQTVGSELSPTLTGFADTLAIVVSRFVELPSPIKWVIGALGLITILVPPLTIMVGSMATSFSLFGRAALKAVPALAKFTWALLQNTAAALTNPWVWLGIAIVALIVGIVLLCKHWDKVKEKIVGIGRAIKQWIPTKLLNFIGMGAGPTAAAAAPASPAASFRDRMSAAPSSSETRIVIDNKNDSKIRAANTEGNMNLQTLFGATMPAFP